MVYLTFSPQLSCHRHSDYVELKWIISTNWISYDYYNDIQKTEIWIAFLDNSACEHRMYVAEGMLAETVMQMASVLALAKPSDIDDSVL